MLLSPVLSQLLLDVAELRDAGLPADDELLRTPQQAQNHPLLATHYQSKCKFTHG
jgi:hypothetical protein